MPLGVIIAPVAVPMDQSQPFDGCFRRTFSVCSSVAVAFSTGSMAAEMPLVHFSRT